MLHRIYRYKRPIFLGLKISCFFDALKKNFQNPISDTNKVQVDTTSVHPFLYYERYISVIRKITS